MQCVHITTSTAQPPPSQRQPQTPQCVVPPAALCCRSGCRRRLRSRLLLLPRYLLSHRLPFAFAAAAAACARAFCTTAATSLAPADCGLSDDGRGAPAECLPPPDVKSMRPLAARSAARRSCSLSQAVFSAS